MTPAGQGPSAPLRDDSFFPLFLPPGIRGVMEIIYHLMWADGLIKLNQKATTVAVRV